MKTKICSKCKIKKPISEFHKDSSTSDGYYSSCRQCRYIKSPYMTKKKELESQRLRECSQCHKIKTLNSFWGKRMNCIECRKKINKNYYLKNKYMILEKMKNNHKQSPWILIFKWIQDRCNNPNINNYHRYGGRGIKCLITLEELKELWFRDKAFEMEQPSIDRINNDGDYTDDNCRFIEWKINKTKDKKRKILQYDLQGNFIKEWESITQAQKKYGKAVLDCLTERTKTSYGFKWKYKDVKKRNN